MLGIPVFNSTKSHDDFHSEKRGRKVSIKSQLRRRLHLQRLQFRKGSFLKGGRSVQIFLHVMNRNKDRPASERGATNSNPTVQVVLKRGMSASPRSLKTCAGDLVECRNQT